MIEPIQDFLERLDQEQQANRQAVKKLEKFKRDMDKLQVNFLNLLKLPMILKAVVVVVSVAVAFVVDVVVFWFIAIGCNRQNKIFWKTHP